MKYDRIKIAAKITKNKILPTCKYRFLEFVDDMVCSPFRVKTPQPITCRSP